MGNHAGNSYIRIKIGNEYPKIDIRWTLASKTFKLGYLAGMIDGEGFVGIEKKSPSKKNLGFSPKIAIYNTNKLIIERCDQYFKDLGLACHVMVSNPKRATTIYKPLYRIDMQGMKRVNRLLQYIIPFLAGKKQVAEIVQLYIDSRLSKPMTLSNRNRQIDAYELSLITQVKELNKRGKDKRVLND